MTDTTILKAPVGPGQPNLAEDMRLVRKYLNAFHQRGYLPGSVEISREGGWDASVAQAMQNIENTYFYGEADPNNRLEETDTLFQFLVQIETVDKALVSSLSNEVYVLASVMVPGGADWIKRSTTKTIEIVDGKQRIKKTVNAVKVPGNIRIYLPNILKSLTQRGLNDADMLMVALGTVRAETAAFEPIDEGVSKFNTTPIGTEGRHSYDKYDFRDDLRNSHLGDGALYKGRGFVQLTGHDQYEIVGRQLGLNLLAEPDKANDPVIAAAILAQYLKNNERGIRLALQLNDLKRVRRLVNGGTNGVKEFEDAFAAGRNYLGIVIPEKAKKTIEVKRVLRRSRKEGSQK